MFPADASGDLKLRAAAADVSLMRDDAASVGR